LIVLVYLLAMVQLGVPAYFPDLLLLLVLTAAVFEERNFALIVGLMGGMFIDAGNPGLMGLYMMIYLVIAYGVTIVRRLVHERVVYTLSFCALALIIKYGVTLALAMSLPVWWEALIASGLTLALLVPAYRLVKVVFHYQWKVA
jgi:rod shape-determining protein MreD